MEKTRTAICKDRHGNLVPVHCKLFVNWHGATYLCRTKEQLERDHPELTFLGWVYDMHNQEHLEDIKCAFLSPNVFQINRWVQTVNGFELILIERNAIC